MNTTTEGIATLTLSKQMVKLLKACLAEPEDGRWQLELVRAQKGTLAATDGKSAVILGWSGQQLPDGLYRLDGDHLVYDKPIVETITPDKGQPYEQWNWPKSLEFLVGKSAWATYPICPQGKFWKATLLGIFIEHHAYVDVFLFSHVLTACETARPRFNSEPGIPGEGFVTLREAKDPVQITFRYDERIPDGNFKRAQYNTVDVDVWLMPFNGGNNQPIATGTS
jgi:hypothetical protein